MNFLSNLKTYLGFGGLAGVVGLGALAWWLGAGAVLRIIATAFEIVAPLLRSLVEGLVEYLKILYHGFVDTIDDWRTVVFLFSLLAAVWAWTTIDAQHDAAATLNQCQSSLQKATKKIAQCRRW